MNLKQASELNDYYSVVFTHWPQIHNIIQYARAWGVKVHFAEKQFLSSTVKQEVCECRREAQNLGLGYAPEKVKTQKYKLGQHSIIIFLQIIGV